jgi:hypothetical protein
VFASGSTINSNSTYLTGGGGGIATSIVDTMLGTQLTGAVVSSNLGSCTFIGTTCTGTGFYVLGSTTGDTASGLFSLSVSSGTLTSLSFNLTGANAAFNPCISGGLLASSCASSSPGAGTATTINPGGGSGTGSATAYYLGQVTLPGGGNVLAADLFSQLTLQIDGGISAGGLFTFQADTDLLNGPGSGGGGGVPEPSTLGLVSAALFGLASFKLRRAKKS